MANALAPTPRAIELYDRKYSTPGVPITVTGTAKAMLAGINRFVDTAIALLAQGEDPRGIGGTVWGDTIYRLLIFSLIDGMRVPDASADIIGKHYAHVCIAIESILRLITPTSSAPAVTSALTSALANVANAVATAPEESMHAIASAYASYASRIADIVASSILSSMELQHASFSAVPPTSSRSPPTRESAKTPFTPMELQRASFSPMARTVAQSPAKPAPAPKPSTPMELQRSSISLRALTVSRLPPTPAPAPDPFTPKVPSQTMV